MSDVEKTYDHLSNDDIIKLLSKCRLMNFENFPEEFKEIDVPHGHDLMDLVVSRLKEGQDTSEIINTLLK